jgi:hypothetical protein
MAGAGDEAAQRRNRGAGLEEEDEDWSVIFQKCRDLTVILGNFQILAKMKKFPKAKV